MTTMTREPFPDGPVVSLRINAACDNCNYSGDVAWGPTGAQTPFTRSTEPEPDGSWAVVWHERWCPVWTGETPAVACPRCGAPVETLETHPGYVLAVPGVAAGGREITQHVEWSPEAQARWGGYGAGAKMERAAVFDRAAVTPCGHTFQDVEARAVITLVNAERQRVHDAEVAEVLASHAAVLDGVRALPGPGPTLVARYEVAVRTGSRDACGLLAAILVLAGEETG